MLEKKDQSEVSQFAVYPLTHTNVVVGEADKREGVASLTSLATAYSAENREHFYLLLMWLELKAPQEKYVFPSLTLWNSCVYTTINFISYQNHWLIPIYFPVIKHMHKLIFRRITYIINIPSLSSTLCDGDQKPICIKKVYVKISQVNLQKIFFSW